MSITTEGNIQKYRDKLAGIDQRLAEFREEHASTPDLRRKVYLEERIVEYTHLRRDVEIQLQAITGKETR